MSGVAEASGMPESGFLVGAGGLAYVPPRGGGREAKACGELGEGFAFSQGGQDGQGLGCGLQAAPPRPAGLAVGADGAGEEVRGAA